jgi:hypothetical protein
MTAAAKVVKYLAFALMALFAVLGGAFIIGETFMDRNWASAALTSAAWVVPMLAMSAYALWRPDAATKILAVAAIVTAIFVVSDATLDVVPRDEVGPVGTITVFAVAVALSFLGLHHPAAAGWLLLLVGMANLAGPASRILQRDGAPLGAALGGSSGAVALPVMVIGAVFLIAAFFQSWAEREASHHRPRSDEPVRSARLRLPPRRGR